MPDFRAATFDLSRVDASGKEVGRNVYWKFYAVENVVRVIIHSVLSVQIGQGWWSTAVDTKLQGKATRFRGSYTQNPWHSSPGKHDIYYLDLVDLNEIIRANSHFFLPIIPKIDEWMARIEQVRLPRNVVAHMNWLTPTDRARIDVIHQDIKALAAIVGQKTPLTIP